MPACLPKVEGENEEKHTEQRFVQLCGMPRYERQSRGICFADKQKSPWQISRDAIDFRVEKIAQPDHRAANRSDDSKAVQYPKVRLVFVSP